MKIKVSETRLLQTVGAEFVQGMLSGFSNRKNFREELLQELGINEKILHDESMQISLHDYAKLLTLAIEKSNDEFLGFFKRPSKRGSYALQVRTAIDAPNLMLAMKHLFHTFKLLHDEVSIVLISPSHETVGFALKFHDSSTADNRFLHESMLRTYWQIASWLVGDNLQPIQFEFAFSKPSYSSHYSRIFPAPWIFDTEVSAVFFDSNKFKLPICRDYKSFQNFVAKGPIGVMLPTRDLGVSARVSSYLKQSQPKWPDLAESAKALNMAVSTLQRHLTSEGTSFQTIKDNLRRDVAIYRLQTSNISLAKLSDEMGFSDTGAFQRAFKLWTGHPPGSYKRTNAEI
jgi:AraC-like DNA-binding protein